MSLRRLIVSSAVSGAILSGAALFAQQAMPQDRPPRDDAERNQPQERRPGRNPILVEADQEAPQPGVSPVLRISRGLPESNGLPAPPPAGNYRSYSGQQNNLLAPAVGATHSWLVRLLPADYSDQLDDMAGQGRPGARAVSNGVFSQQENRPNPSNASDFLWQWGQFLDHDIDLTDGMDPPEPADIAIPAGDSWFDPEGSGQRSLSFNRSLYDTATGINKPREQFNEISAWIDASNVYGSDDVRAAALRTLDGSGRLKTSPGNLLPFNEAGLPNAGGSGAELFLAGDVRANEQVGLTVMHTLFVREHNRIADALATQEPVRSGEEIYQLARQIVGAQMQVITYREFLPLLLGQDALAPYRGYDNGFDAGIANSFSTAAYRFGHSALSPTLLRLQADGSPVEDGHLALRDAFFSPGLLQAGNDLDPYLRGLAQQVHQRIDSYVIDDVRNFLFGAPGAGGFDLVSLNIQRGRDHGLPSYNDARRALGLAPARRFSDISSSRQVTSRLRDTYGSVDDIDLWVGGLAEDNFRDAMVGETFFIILKDQFEALRDGDRFWYQNIFSGDEQRLIERTRLADIIRRNTGIGNEISDNVFVVPTVVN